MSDDGDNVVRFPGHAWTRDSNAREAERDEAPLRRDRTPSPCRHDRSAVDEANRRVYCRDCKAELDPYVVLAQIAAARERLVATAQRYRSEIDALRRTHEGLQREERNAKSRIRNARRSRDDRDALIAAASAVPPNRLDGVRIGGYRPYEACSEPQREVVLVHVRAIVEAYLAKLAEPSADSGAA